MKTEFIQKSKKIFKIYQISSKSTNVLVKTHQLICDFCKNSFYSQSARQKCCSQSCASKKTWSNDKYKNVLISKARSRVANGTHKGWASRSKIAPSFPEKVTMEIINELGISNLEREFKCGKWFIDFADVNRKIALEIDGKQHDLPDRKASDEIKDAFLIQEGWSIHRIKWEKLTKESRVVLKDRIRDIFKL